MKGPLTHQLAQTGSPRAMLGSPPHSFIPQPMGLLQPLALPAPRPTSCPCQAVMPTAGRALGKRKLDPVTPWPATLQPCCSRGVLCRSDSSVAGGPRRLAPPPSVLSTSVLPLTGSFLRPLLPDVCTPGPCPPERLCPRSSSARSTLPTKTQAGSLPSAGQAEVSPREAFPEHLIYTAGWPRLQLRVGIKIC